MIRDPTTSLSRHYWTVAAVLAVASVILAPLATGWFAQPWWVHWDMGINAYNGYHAGQGQTLHGELHTSYPGGIELWIGWLMRWFGPDLNCVYFPVAVLGALNVLLAGAIARQVADDWCGIVAMIGTFLAGPATAYSGYPAWYALTFGLAALWGLLCYTRTGLRRWLIVVGLALGLAAVAKHSVAAFYASWTTVALLISYLAKQGPTAEAGCHWATRLAAVGLTSVVFLGTGGLAVFPLQHHAGPRTLTVFAALPLAVLAVLGAWAVCRQWRRPTWAWLGPLCLIGGLALLPVLALVIHFVQTGTLRTAIDDLFVRPWVFTETLHVPYPLSAQKLLVYVGLTLLGMAACLVPLPRAWRSSGRISAGLAAGAITLGLGRYWQITYSEPLMRMRELPFYLPIGVGGIAVCCLAVDVWRGHLGWPRNRALVAVLGFAFAGHWTMYPTSLEPYLCYCLPFYLLVAGHLLSRFGTRVSAMANVAGEGDVLRWPVWIVGRWAVPGFLVAVVLLPRLVVFPPGEPHEQGTPHRVAQVDDQRGHIRLDARRVAGIQPVVEYLRQSPERSTLILSLNGWLLGFLSDLDLPAFDTQEKLYWLMRRDRQQTAQIHAEILAFLNEHRTDQYVADMHHYRALQRDHPGMFRRLRDYYEPVWRNLDFVILARKKALARS